MYDPKTQKMCNHSIVRAMTCSPPGCRMVVVAAYYDLNPDETEIEKAVNVVHEIHPVVALQTEIRDSYSIVVHKDEWAAPRQNHREMIKAGWRFEWQEINVEPMLIAEEGIVDLPFFRSSNGVETAVPCPWPVEQDDERLAKVIAETRDSAKGRGVSAFNRQKKKSVEAVAD